MTLTEQDWNIGHLREHLQYAVDLERWTIPFYMSAMYSVVDVTDPAYQLIQSIVNQEMLHAQFAANLANSYGLSPDFYDLEYKDQEVPHLNFNLDKPDPRKIYHPYTAEIGPLDLEHANAMCLIEYPDWATGHKPDLNEDASKYGSIGEFYDAIQYGATLLKDDLRGGVRQLNLFAAFYRNLPIGTISGVGDEGLAQAMMLIDAIREQGEGAGKKAKGQIPSVFQNTADDPNPSLDHYAKFRKIRQAILEGNPPKTWPVKQPVDYGDFEKELEGILIQNFGELQMVLRALFAGESPPEFIQTMVTVGANIRNCWKHGVTPRFC